MRPGHRGVDARRWRRRASIAARVRWGWAAFVGIVATNAAHPLREPPDRSRRLAADPDPPLGAPPDRSRRLAADADPPLGARPRPADRRSDLQRPQRRIQPAEALARVGVGLDP